MDISALLMPGAQKLTTAILSDAWPMARDAIARRWGRNNRTETDTVTAELEDARSKALALYDGAQPDQRLLDAFLAGYMAALARTDPERVHALLEMDLEPVTQPRVTVSNQMSGRAEKVIQAGDINGSITMS